MSYARLCGYTLTRSDNPVALAAYLGRKDRFDQSITDFALRYADQNETRLSGLHGSDPLGRPAALDDV